jgi:TRAP-type C4-dicarboxylate transport system permease small subunit
MRKSVVFLFNLIHIVMVYLAQVLMVAMVVIIFINVILRYIFNSGWVWSEEVALLLAVWFIFIAMSLGVKQDLHININIIPSKKIPPPLARVFTILKSIAIFIIGFVMLTDGWKLVGVTMKSILPATGWPAGLLYAILPIASIVMIYESLMDLLGIDTRDKAVDEFLSGKGSLKDVLGGSHD